MVSNHAVYAPDQAWWLTLNDAVLNQLMAQAMRANPDVLSAASAIRQARALRSQTQGGLGPQLGASAGATAQSTEQASSSVYNAGLDASWELDVFGGGRMALSARDAQVLASQADYADVLVSLSGEVVLNYLQLRALQQQLTLTQSSLQSWLDTLDLTKMQYQAGLVTQLPVEQATRSYQQTASSVPGLQQRIKQTQTQLAVLLGQAPQALPAGLNTLNDSQYDSALPNVPASVLLPLPADLLRQRPDVQAAEQRLLAAMALTDEARANLWPKLNLRGSLTSNGANLSDVLSVDGLISTLTLGVTQVLFDGGAREAQRQSQAEQEHQAWLNYQKILLNALKETQDALSGLHASRQTHRSLTLALQAAEQEEQLALIQYQVGEQGFSDVLVAQRTRLSLRQQFIDVQVDELTQLVSLSKAIAGHWALSQAPVSTPDTLVPFAPYSSPVLE
jgi:NodT family efflux transporter outer membrane factor (OMF) lipoprotein